MNMHCNTKGHSTWWKGQEAEQTALSDGARCVEMTFEMTKTLLKSKRRILKMQNASTSRISHASSCRNLTGCFVDAGSSSFCSRDDTLQSTCVSGYP